MYDRKKVKEMLEKEPAKFKKIYYKYQSHAAACRALKINEDTLARYLKKHNVPKINFQYQYTLKDMHKIAQNNDGKCLSKKFKGVTKKLLWQCKLGHTWKCKPSSIINGTWCIICAGKAKHTIENANKIAEKRGGKCLSKKYINGKSSLKWQCALGHTWNASFSSIHNNKSWCPYCSSYAYEEICRNILEQTFNNKFPKYRSGWLINTENNKMELDGYCSELGIAFEHHGLQHYKIISKFKMTKKDLEKRAANDKLKEKLCHNKGIKLIIIPELFSLTPLDKLENIINQQLINKVTITKKMIENAIAKAYKKSKYKLEEINNIAKKRGEECISQKYSGVKNKLTFRCKNGHIYKSNPYTYKNGTGCPTCAGNQKHSVNDVIATSNNLNIKCLSKKYKNNKTKMKFECSSGHVFEKSYADLIKSTGCPKCYIINRYKI